MILALAAGLLMEGGVDRVSAESATGTEQTLREDGRVGTSALGRIEPRDGVRHVAGPPRPTLVIEKLLVAEGDRVSAGQSLRS